MKLRRVVVLTVFLLACSWQSVLAEGYALYEYSARAIALGGATMARKADPSAVAGNPALITQLPGIQMLTGASTIAPKGKMTTRYGGDSRTTELKDDTWLAPHAYYTQQLTDTLFFGVGAFSRFGLGFEYPHNWPGRYNVYSVGLQAISLNPNIAWKATDSFSLAAGLEIMDVTLDLKKKVPLTQKSPGIAGTPLAGAFPASPQFNNSDAAQVDSNIQNASNTGIGVNVGGHYQFNDQWAAGLLYRSQVSIRARGENQFTVENVGHLPGYAQTALKNGYQDSSAHSTVVLPDSVAGGVSWSPRKDLSFEAGAIWTRWSTFKTLRIHLGGPTNAVSESRKEWDDAWRFNFGVEYEPLDWMVLRAGYVHDQSPMTEEYADYLVPTDGRNIYSGGAGFKWGAATFDLTYAFIDATGRRYRENLALGVLDSKAKGGETHIFSVSLMYEF